jgi:hypothetical protein
MFCGRPQKPFRIRGRLRTFRTAIKGDFAIAESTTTWNPIMNQKQTVSLQTKMLRVVRKAEAEARTENAQDTGTGQTIIKLARSQPPLRSLVESGKIGPDELAAAEEIALAVTAVSGRGILSGIVFERVDRGRSDLDWPAHIAIAVRNYQRWQMHWSNEWKRDRNPMLSIIWDAVIDARPIAQIAADADISRHLARRAICAGLRHYAVRAGLTSGNHARAWLDEAQGLVFKTVVVTRS